MNPLGGMNVVPRQAGDELQHLRAPALVDDALARWPLLGVTVIHRVGRLEPGARIVLVATASRHRAAALESCAFLIDWLKSQAPFWKKEHFADGATAWVAARIEDADKARGWNG